MNRRKILLIRILKIIAVLLPAAALVLLLPINDYDDAARLKAYYLEKPGTIDVLVMGSSEDYAGYNPMLAYEEFGFTSYPYVLSANAFSLFPAQLEEALRVQSPQLVVVDVAEIVFPKGQENTDTVFRQFAAGIPMSKLKLQQISKHGDPDDLLSYYFPFIVNHGKATPKKLLEYVHENAAMRKRGYSVLKGTLTFTGSGENWDGPYVTPINTTGDDSTAELLPEVRNDCLAMLDACKAHPETKFLFINYPHRITTEESYRAYQAVNSVGELIRGSGYDFVNLESMLDDMGLEPETDFYNNHHMNLYGQYKVTRFLCGLLTQKYGVSGSPRSAETTAEWETCVEYSHLYFDMFDELFKARDPGDFGNWLIESEDLIAMLDGRKAA